MSYRRMPDRLYDDPDELAQWAARAFCSCPEQVGATSENRQTGGANDGQKCAEAQSGHTKALANRRAQKGRECNKAERDQATTKGKA